MEEVEEEEEESREGGSIIFLRSGNNIILTSSSRRTGEDVDDPPGPFKSLINRLSFGFLFRLYGSSVCLDYIVQVVCLDDLVPVSGQASSYIIGGGARGEVRGVAWALRAICGLRAPAIPMSPMNPMR